MRSLASAVVLLVFALAGCKRSSSAPRGEDAAVSSAAPARPSASESPEAERATRALAPSCRAISVEGAVAWLEGDDADGGPALFADREVPPEGWLSLGPSARVVVKDGRTSRETTFTGPGRARACVLHREESWLAAGRFDSSVGSGETPGAEEWVVTPEAVVRYTAAQLRVEANAAHGSVAVGSGTAFVWVPDDVDARPIPLADAGRGAATPHDAGRGAATPHDAGRGTAAPHDAGRAPPTATEASAVDQSDPPWLRVGAGALELQMAHGMDPRAAAAACALHATRAHDAARAMMSRRDAGIEGGEERIREQIRERRLAHAACALAEVRAASMPAAQAAVLRDALRDARRQWAQVPVAEP